MQQSSAAEQVKVNTSSQLRDLEMKLIEATIGYQEEVRLREIDMACSTQPLTKEENERLEKEEEAIKLKREMRALMALQPNTAMEQPPDVTVNNDPTQKISTKNKSSVMQKYKRMSASAKRLFNILVGICTIIACIAAVIVIPQVQQLLLPNSPNFSYQVRVQREGTGEIIKDAKVTIEVAGTVPLSGYTGSDGYARIFVDAAYAGQPGRLRVEAIGYEPYWKEMDISKGSLPDLIYLTPLP